VVDVGRGGGGGGVKRRRKGGDGFGAGEVQVKSMDVIGVMKGMMMIRGRGR